MATQTTSIEAIQQQIAELEKQKQLLESQFHARKGEEAKVLADAFARKLAAAGLTVAEGIAALKPYSKVKIGSVRATGPRAEPVRLEKGRVYKDPAGIAKDYVGGVRGAKPKWLTAEVAAGTGNEKKTD